MFNEWKWKFRLSFFFHIEISNSCTFIDEDFNQPLFECPIDLRKLYSLINFDIRKRYTDLMEFYQKHHFINELKLVETKLDVIRQSISSPLESNKNEKRKCSSNMIKSKSSTKHFKSD